MNGISLQATRQAQAVWATTSLKQRLAILHNCRTIIAARAAEFADAVDLPGRRQPVATLPLEVLPLLDALKWLEGEAITLLRPRKLGRKGRPLWLHGAVASIHREAIGVILIIAPFNYPLLLAGVQALQALAAGNAVWIKPATGHAAAMALLGECLAQAGLPTGLFTVLDDTIEAGQAALAAGPDKIVLTGSAATGRAVLAEAARQLTPAIMELSGNDAVFVLPGADLTLLVEALAYGLVLNGGATCIAPRRVFLPAAMLADVQAALGNTVTAMPACYVGESVAGKTAALLDQAKQQGATVIGGALPETGMMAPAIVINPAAASPLLTEDIFAPVLSLIAVDTPADALLLADACPLALGASVFGPVTEATAFARQDRAGVVVVNDLIVPTIDPRLPFEPQGKSGYGATRGPDGLLAMTRAKAVTTMHGSLRFHYRPVRAKDAALYLAFIAAAHGGGGLGRRIRSLIAVVRALRNFR